MAAKNSTLEKLKNWSLIAKQVKGRMGKNDRRFTLAIIHRRKEVKSGTLQERMDYNRIASKQSSSH